MNLLILLVALASVASGEEFAPVVKTKLGPVRGLVVEADQQQVHFYQGIKYGHVAKRFQLAKMTTPWSEVYNATKPRDACPQIGKDLANGTTANDSGVFEETSTMSEDCLYVNVWRPAKPSNATRSVMVWIHGGTFQGGTIFSDQFDARYLVTTGDVIVVLVNYRLGAFGFLYDGTSEAPGNQGLHDQILALKWVKQNIAAFGGDPAKVTLFGESAGSMAVGALVLSPLAKGLFHRAILQSGAPNSYVGSNSLNTSLSKTAYLADQLKCNNSDRAAQLECLRNTSVYDILEACQFDVVIGQLKIPIYGDTLLPVNPVTALKTGAFNHVDLIYGVTRNEGSGFVVQFLPIILPESNLKNLTVKMAQTAIKRLLAIIKSPYGTEAAKFYTKNFTSNATQFELRNAIADSFGDFHLVCPTILFGEQFAATRRYSERYYAYRLMSPLTHGCKPSLGVCHGQDVDYIFARPVRHPEQSTPKEAELSRQMMQAWTRYANRGAPGEVGEAKWDEAVNATRPATDHMALQEQANHMVHAYFVEACDRFWRPKIFV